MKIQSLCVHPHADDETGGFVVCKVFLEPHSKTVYIIQFLTSSDEIILLFLYYIFIIKVLLTLMLYSTVCTHNGCSMMGY